MIGHIVRHEPHRRRATVQSTERLSERIVRIVLRLDAESAPVPSLEMAVGEHVKLAFPDPHTGDLDLAAGRDKLVTRDYTIRAVSGGANDSAATLVVDVVLHGSGPGSEWAQAAKEGSVVGVLGPRGSHVMPTDRPRYLVLGDESAHPAVARWLEEAPAESEVQVVIQSPDGGTADLPAREGTRIRHVTGVDGAALADELRALSPRPNELVWAAGEATAMLAVRRVARELGVATEDLKVDGYWKVGVAGRDHHEPLEA